MTYILQITLFLLAFTSWANRPVSFENEVKCPFNLELTEREKELLRVLQDEVEEYFSRTDLTPNQLRVKIAVIGFLKGGLYEGRSSFEMPPLFDKVVEIIDYDLELRGRRLGLSQEAKYELGLGKLTFGHLKMILSDYIDSTITHDTVFIDRKIIHDYESRFIETENSNAKVARLDFKPVFAHLASGSLLNTLVKYLDENAYIEFSLNYLVSRSMLLGWDAIFSSDGQGRGLLEGISVLIRRGSRIGNKNIGILALNARVLPFPNVELLKGQPEYVVRDRLKTFGRSRDYDLLGNQIRVTMRAQGLPEPQGSARSSMR